MCGLKESLGFTGTHQKSFHLTIRLIRFGLHQKIIIQFIGHGESLSIGKVLTLSE